MTAAARVAVVKGGPSSEAEVSRKSAASVAKGLEAAGFQVSAHELGPELAETLRTGGFDVVFPIVHGKLGEDGALQGLLEVLDLPYVGSDVLASALAMHKATAKKLFAAAGLPVAPSLTSARGGEGARAAAERAIAELGARVVVKPCSNGSAIGVARFDAGATPDDLARAIEAAWGVDDVVLVERFATGREVTCGVLEVAEDVLGGHALPPTEIRAPNDAFYTYEARYAPGRSEHLCPAPLGASLLARVQDVAVRAHRALGCRDLSRVDFVVRTPEDGAAGEGEVTLLEVNTLPGFTDTSLFPEAAAIAGIPMPELCRRLVEAALRRPRPRRPTPVPLPR